MLNAYRQKYNLTSEFFHLAHEGVRIDPFDVVEFLQDGANVVVLKAVDGLGEEEQAITSQASLNKAKPPLTPPCVAEDSVERYTIPRMETP